MPRSRPTSRRSARRPVPGRRPLAGLIAGMALLVGVLVPASPAAAAPTPPAFDSAIEAFAPYQGQTACDPVARPGVIAFRDLVLAAYPGTGDSGIVRACSAGGTSEHKEGRAWDWRVNTSNPLQVEQVDDFHAWLLAPDEFGNAAAMARRLGVMYIIWDAKIWKSYQATRGWQPYVGASPHTDHVHVSFSWAGALGATSYWTGQVAPVMTRPVPPPVVVADTATATIDITPPVMSGRALFERRQRFVQNLPGPWRRH